jgi:hypothetical protein
MTYLEAQMTGSGVPGLAWQTRDITQRKLFYCPGAGGVAGADPGAAGGGPS